IVVIYEENHSFDNLYGGWEGVNGLANADPAHTTQVDQNGVPYTCLKQLDANLTSPPLTATCNDAAHGITSHFTNNRFTIDDYIGPSAITCPPVLHAFSYPNGILDPGINPATGLPIPGALPGGCTRDLVHEFYQDQYQENGGQQNRYMTGSDSVGTSMGVYDTKALPIYQYLHSKGAPDYAIDDNSFQAAFGGSFLNHQWLVAAASPVFPGATASQHTIIDSNGMPVSYPLYTATGPVSRQAVTVACGAGGVPPAPAAVCGNWAVNTMQPPYFPSGTFGPVISPQTGATIGDRLNDAGVDWAWYSGGWSNANGDVGAPGWTNGSAPGATTTGCLDPNVDPNNRAGVPASMWPRCPNNLFQYHHQPFNYYAAFSTATPAGLANRAAHLKDEAEFSHLADASTKKVCDLKPVSFVKPIGQENEHPGYASEPNGNDHLVSLLQSIEGSACAKDTMVIVTYDEFGGQWDHVPAPGQGNDNGPHDVWGPGTRIPTLILAPHLKGNFVVDSAEHDTTSILATIEHRFGLQPLGTRDAAVNDLSTVFNAKKSRH
ncbi:MAG: alkaline phosphatase family protein, partial [Chloroflexota bacterium]